MGGSAAAPMPYQQVTTTEEMPKWKKQLLGFTPDAPEYSPFKALSRQAATQAKMIEGMTTRPTWSSIYAAMGVPQGQDLTPYIQAMRQGTSMPMAPIPQSPEAGTIPAFIPPSDTGKAPKKKAEGGLMSLRKYAPGGNVRTLNTSQAQAVTRYNNLVAQGKEIPPALVKRINTIEDRTGRNVSPFVDSGTAPVRNQAVQNAMARAAGSGNAPTEGVAGTAPYQAVAQAFPDSRAVTTTYTKAQQAAADKAAAAADKASEPPVPLSQAMTVQTPFFAGEEAARADRQYAGITNPIYQQALDQLRAASNAPETIGQGAGIMSTAAGRLLDQAGSFTPQQVGDITAAQMGPYERAGATRADVANYNAALMNAPKEAEVKDYQAAQMQAAEMQRARDVTAPTAQAYTYNASQMRAPGDITAGDYTAAQAAANQMAQPRDVTGQTYSAADIAKTQREVAQQIGDIGTISGQGYNAARIGPTAREQGVTTTAPKSWTDAGIASQYMSPYMQNVVDIQKRESMRDYAKQLNQLKSQAVGAKAYGGSRLAIEQAEAARNQAQRLGDIEAQGLQQAYQQGMGQFSTEQGLGSQVGMANTAQINQLKSQYMQMGMTEAQANQAAINQARQFTASQGQAAQTQNVSNQLAAQQANAQMVNQLKSQYMSMGLSEAQANQAAQNAASQFGAQSAQQAALANQQAGLTTGQANLSAAQQTAMANMQAINQQRQTAVNNALQAAMTSYGGKLTAAQQNMIADNAAQQFNAQNQTQISQANAQMNLAAQQSNQSADLTTNQANAQFQQQAAAANQAATNQQRQNYVNNALQAAMQSYGGQLTAAQQNQVAQNAAAQFNAQSQNVANNAFAAQSLQAGLANQQAGLTTAQQNAQLAQQASLANQQASVQNQQAGLTAQGLNLQALNQAGQIGQGLGSLGVSTWNQQQNLPQLWGAAGQTVQGIAQQAATGAQQTAQNWLGGMANAYQAPVNLLTGTPGATGTKNISQLPG